MTSTNAKSSRPPKIDPGEIETPPPSNIRREKFVLTSSATPAGHACRSASSESQENSLNVKQITEKGL
jgi:hypothetical protein